MQSSPFLIICYDQHNSPCIYHIRQVRGTFCPGQSKPNKCQCTLEIVCTWDGTLNFWVLLLRRANSHNEIPATSKLESRFFGISDKQNLARSALLFHEFLIRLCVQGCKCLHGIVSFCTDKLSMKFSLF